MKYSITENLQDRKGVISNLHCFLNRHMDTGFKSKWSGFWSPPYKFMDYYAIKVNGVWLGENTVEAAEYGDKMVFHHETDSLRITEKVSAPSTTPGIKLELDFENKTDEKKAVHVALEPGVDIRDKGTDIDETSYRTEKGPNRVTVSRNNKKLMISSHENFELNGGSYVKTHEPGETQKCFIPGHLSFRKELETQSDLEIDFTTSKGVFGELQEIDQSFEGEELGRLFNYSLESVKNLIYDKEDTGVIAGHPWFQSFWARDSFWTVLGLIDAGYFELSEDILTNFAEKGLPGKINLDDEDEYDEFPRSDTVPLFIIAANKLERHFRTNDIIEEAKEEAIESLSLDDNLVDHAPGGTWMDTLERENAVDIQSLWLKAAELEDLDIREKLESGLEKFEKEEYMKDSLGENSAETINPAIPLMYREIDAEKASKYLEKINGEFLSRFGARTRSMADPGYESSGYHKGSTWGLTTCWAAAANLSYGKEKTGKTILKKLNQFLDRGQLGALPEVVDSEKGHLMGCSEQAWSAGMALHVIDSYLLGINVKKSGEVVIDPCADLTCLRTGKRVRDQELDIKVSDGEVEILNDPDIKIELRGE